MPSIRERCLEWVKTDRALMAASDAMGHCVDLKVLASGLAAAIEMMPTDEVDKDRSLLLELTEVVLGYIRPDRKVRSTLCERIERIEKLMAEVRDAQ